jgi:hypothetical protein
MKKTRIRTFMKLWKNRKLFYIFFCFIYCGCGNNSISEFTSINKKQINTDEITKRKKTNLPEILFENLSYNFGDLIQEEQVNYTFHFKNVGQSDLIISSVDVSCGCTTPVYTKEPIKPDEQGYIAITLDTKAKNGEVTAHLVVSANTYPAQTVLTINANVVNVKKY